MTANTLAMFPGQGSQYVGMGRSLLEQFPQVASTFEEAEDAAGFGIRKLCFDGPESDLTLTANTQPCILTVSIATWRTLKNETGIDPVGFAGHSLGEYAALVAAGRLDFARAVSLVRKRGQAMQAAVPAGVGAMAAVMNFAPEELEAKCEQASTADATVEIANYNSPQQLVVAGHKEAVDRLCAALEQEGVRFVLLQVSAPFHSRLMVQAREDMTPLLNDSEFADNGSKVIANLTGQVEASYDASFLIKQIDSPVRWIQSMVTAHETLGCEAFVEVGPGKVLQGLAKRCLPKGQTLLGSDPIEKAIASLQG